MKIIKLEIDNGHGVNTLGKHSPDMRLREYAWTREIAKRLHKSLKERGHDVDLLVPEETDVSISERVNRVNKVCAKYGSKNVLLVSIHNNAAGNGLWSPANGFSVFVSKNASSNSKKCASIFTEKAIARKLTGNRSIPKDKFWTWSWTKSDIGILKNSNCPAVLTENMFMDNKDDLEFLLSEKGKQTIVDLHVEAIEEYIKTL